MINDLYHQAVIDSYVYIYGAARVRPIYFPTKETLLRFLLLNLALLRKLT